MTGFPGLCWIDWINFLWFEFKRFCCKSQGKIFIGLNRLNACLQAHTFPKVLNFWKGSLSEMQASKIFWHTRRIKWSCF